MSSSNSNSCVETPAAPDWLSKLEDRREKLKRSKLGHETGAGAPCNECGSKCPGLDLHFWRKVCRNCKCRKDQHMCQDDEVSGWAQFEILGQIRSKPAFIKIKTLANQPVKVEWIPPNVGPDLAADYMEKLGTANVPVAGSEAAARRKQQLEFQVPPHDLDPGFCDNLTESEAHQLQQYVQKIRDNCVGQGNVVRVGNHANAMLGTINNLKKEYADIMLALEEPPVSDYTLSSILTNKKLAKAITESMPCEYPKIFVVFSEAISDAPLSTQIDSKLSPALKQKLRGLDEAAVQSLILNGPVYDKIFGVLQKKKFDISRDPRLGPLHDLRKEYLSNSFARKELNNVFGFEINKNKSFDSPITSPSRFVNDLTFNSPLPIKGATNVRTGSQMFQETPARKVQFANSSSIIHECSLPSNVDYERDPIFIKIIRSEPLNRAIKHFNSTKQSQIISLPTSIAGFGDINETVLSEQVKEKLQKLRIGSKNMLQSAVLNAPFYERLFADLQEKNFDYSECEILKPIEKLCNAFRTDRPLYEEVREFVTSLPNSLDVVYTPINMGLQEELSISKSSDSGFDSKPSTPIQGTSQCYPEEINALSGKIVSIPGIEDMNMYPIIEASKSMKNLSVNEHTLRQQQNKILSGEPTALMLKCTDCKKTIRFGEVAVKAERAGKEMAWHPQCFKCFTCRELLADLVYFFHSGQVFCGRDLALKLKIPRCKACDELIFTKEYTAAEGATFHIKHFCCYHCDSPLAGKQYIPDEKSNMPLCLKCYNEYFAVACQKCSQTIGPLDQGVAWVDIHWHDSCFNCAGKSCGKSLIGGRFCVKENMPFCSPACVRSIIK